MDNYDTNDRLRELGLSVIASENLARSTESLKLGVMIELSNDSTKQFHQTNAWQEHEALLRQYTEKLVLLEEHKRQQHQTSQKFGLLLSKVSLVGTVVMLISSILMVKRKKQKTAA